MAAGLEDEDDNEAEDDEQEEEDAFPLARVLLVPGSRGGGREKGRGGTREGKDGKEGDEKEGFPS